MATSQCTYGVTGIRLDLLAIRAVQQLSPDHREDVSS